MHLITHQRDVNYAVLICIAGGAWDHDVITTTTDIPPSVTRAVTTTSLRRHYDVIATIFIESFCHARRHHDVITTTNDIPAATVALIRIRLSLKSASHLIPPSYHRHRGVVTSGSMTPHHAPPHHHG